MTKPKKIALTLFLLFSLIGSIFSLLYFIVNVSEIPSKISKEIKTYSDADKTASELLSPEAQPIEKKSIDLKKDVVDFFKSITIDLSAITSFLLLWFFMSININIIKVLLKRLTKDQLYEKYDTLPMPKTYDTTWIQLGFIGTLWGFMIIGIRMSQIGGMQSSETIDILLMAFGTALLSTFTAVLLVYIFAPIAIHLWKWIFDIKERKSEIEVIDQLHGRLEKISGRVNALNTDITKINTTIDTFNRTIQTSIDAFGESIQKLQENVSTFHPSKLVVLLEQVSSNINKLGSIISSQESITRETIVNETDKILEQNLKSDEIITEFFTDSKSRHTDLVQKMDVIGQNLMEKLEQTGDKFIAVNETRQKETKTLFHNIEEILKNIIEKLKFFSSESKEIYKNIEISLRDLKLELIKLVSSDKKESIKLLKDIADSLSVLDENLGRFKLESKDGNQQVKKSLETIDQHLIDTNKSSIEKIEETAVHLKAITDTLSAIDKLFTTFSAESKNKHEDIKALVGKKLTAIEDRLKLMSDDTGKGFKTIDKDIDALRQTVKKSAESIEEVIKKDVKSIPDAVLAKLKDIIKELEKKIERLLKMGKLI